MDPVPGKSFAVDRWSNLLSLDVTACEVEHGAHGVRLPQTMWLVNKYLADSNGEELLMVRRFSTFDDNRPRTTMEFQVFKMDFNKGKWIKKKTLGDVAIFLGDNSAVSVLASNFHGCEPNCIYFSHDQDRVTIDFRDQGPQDCGAYDLLNKSSSQPYAADVVEDDQAISIVGCAIFADVYSSKTTHFFFLVLKNSNQLKEI